MKCPVCALQSDEKEFCPQCGWEFYLFLEDDKFSEKRLSIARKRWKVLKSSVKQVKTLKKQMADMSLELTKSNTENSCQAESSDTLSLKRDPFETFEEFRKRINEYKEPVPVGTALLLKEHYDINTGKFPLKISWKECVKCLKSAPSEKTDFHIVAKRELARLLYEAGNHKVFAKAKASADEAEIDSFELHVSDQIIPINEVWHPSTGKTWTEPMTKMEFLWIPHGYFMMGSSDTEKGRNKDEGPQREVFVDGFWMGKYPVSQKQWHQVMGDKKGRAAHFQLGDVYPIENISWNEAKAFIEKLTDLNQNKYKFALPTEAEWEYACRAGSATPYYFGEKISPEDANYGDNEGSTTPAESFRPNNFGLYDMHGNVWEWCEDIYSENAYKNTGLINPLYTGEGLYRVIRGGSWISNAEFLRCANRYYYLPDARNGDLGFRLLRRAS